MRQRVVTVTHKRVLAFVLVLLMISTMLPVGMLQTQKVEAAPAGQAIRTEAELRKISMSGEYYLANDIELTSPWTTLGSFRGILDGNGYVIKGLEVTEGVDDGAGIQLYGLFREIVSSGTVRNLGIEGKVVIQEVEESDGAVAGLLAGIISNGYYTQQGEIRIHNCYVKGEIVKNSAVDYQLVGGLTGSYVEGVGANCYSAVKGADIYGASSIAKLSKFYTDTTLYAGKLQTGVTGKTSAQMMSFEFAELLTTNTTSVKWAQGEDGYPKLSLLVEETPEKEIVYISTEEELKKITNDLDAHYVLKANIALSNVWTPIGTSAAPFTGILDGNGYEITGLNISGAGKETSLGLFAVSTGTVKNLGVKGKIVVTSAYPDDLGLIVGLNKGTVINCYAEGAITPKYARRVGLIAGNNINGKVTNCYGVGTTGKTYTITVGGSFDGGMNYYNKDFFPSVSITDVSAGKTTAEMKSKEFVVLLNSGRSENREWHAVEGSYPLLRKQKVEVIVDTDTLLSNISKEYETTVDPFGIIDMVANKQADQLVNKEDVIKEAVSLIKNTQVSNYGTELEKYIIALSALGVDAANILYNGEWYDAIEALGQIDMSDELVNSLIFAVNAYHSGEYEVAVNALQSEEELIQLLLDEQKSDGGFTFAGKKGDVDMTAMALHALAPYYTAKNQSAAGISAPLYEEVKQAVEKAIKMLSDAQNEDSTFSSGNTVNSNSSSMVVVALSALGIDADQDERFVKDETGAVEALLNYVSNDLSGFKWRVTDSKINAMATEQGFRALVSYNRMKETGTAFNIYSFGEIRTVRPTPEPTVEPSVEPTVAPTVEPTVGPTVEPTVKPTVEPSIEPTVEPSIEPTVEPSVEPTVEPSVEPTVEPSVEPTVKPSAAPTAKPSTTPTAKPSVVPTVKPSTAPTAKPSTTPTVKPSAAPTVKPSTTPTAKPSTAPMVKPSVKPTVKPSTTPTVKPSAAPTAKPSTVPTVKPSTTPTVTSAPSAEVIVEELNVIEGSAENKLLTEEELMTGTEGSTETESSVETEVSTETESPVEQEEQKAMPIATVVSIVSACSGIGAAGIYLVLRKRK